MATYPITVEQAEFLNELSRAASIYRKQAESLKLEIPERIKQMSQGWEPRDLPLAEMLKAEVRYNTMWGMAGHTLSSMGMSTADIDKYVKLAGAEDENAYGGKHFFMAEKS